MPRPLGVWSAACGLTMAMNGRHGCRCGNSGSAQGRVLSLRCLSGAEQPETDSDRSGSKSSTVGARGAQSALQAPVLLQQARLSALAVGAPTHNPSGGSKMRLVAVVIEARDANAPLQPALYFSA